MKISLINPNLDGFSIPNTGLAYLISSIEKEHKIKLLDMTFHIKHYDRYILSHINEFKPDIIGFSTTSYTFRHALKIASLIRNNCPEIPLVYGGVHPTLMPEGTIQNPLVDAICIGEGEDSFREYIQQFKNKQEPKSVAGMWYKEATGNIVRNPLRPFREDIDSIAFPNWDHWEIERYMKTNLFFVDSIEHIFSRGCPYSCTFCSNPAISKAIPGKFYRVRNPENVIEEIKLNLAKYSSRGFKTISFSDATFGLDLDCLKRFCSLYKKENLHLDLAWVCQTRADIVTEEWANIAAEAGCFMVSLGIESGNDYIRRKVYRKDITKEQMISAINVLKRNNIIHAIFIMIGCFEETRASIKDTMDLLRITEPISTYFSFYQPLPKTELGEVTKKYVIKSEDKRAKPWNTTCISVRDMTVFELRILIVKIRILKVYKFFMLGIKLKGMEFIVELIKYLLAIGGSRTMSLRNPYIAIDLEYRTLYKYLLDSWKRNFLNGLKHKNHIH